MVNNCNQNQQNNQVFTT